MNLEALKEMGEETYAFCETLYNEFKKVDAKNLSISNIQIMAEIGKKSFIEESVNNDEFKKIVLMSIVGQIVLKDKLTASENYPSG